MLYYRSMVLLGKTSCIWKHKEAIRSRILGISHKMDNALNDDNEDNDENHAIHRNMRHPKSTIEGKYAGNNFQF